MRIETTFRKNRKKIVLILLILFSATVYAHAQDGSVNFSKPQMSAKKAFEEIRKQTKYTVAYENRIFDDGQSIKLTTYAQSLEEAMEEVLRGTGFTYSVYGRIISLTPAPEGKKTITASPVAAMDPDYYRSRVDYNSFLSRKRTLPAPDIQIRDSTRVSGDTEYREAGSNSFSHILPPERYLGNKLPRLAVKTNLLYGISTLSPNLALEGGLGKRTTLELSIGTNTWNYRGTEEGNKKFMHTLVRPEIRYWTCERFNGHFFGLHAFYAQYNIGTYDVPLLFEKEYRYYGNAVGAGITYGYHLMLAKRWGVEFNIGAGIAFMNYKKYACTTCIPDYEKVKKTYIGPTRAGITMVFLIK